MNNLIKEFAEQCLVDDNEAFDFGKFAELIINECSQTLSTLAKAYEGSESDSDYADALTDAADIIKEHFGIK